MTDRELETRLADLRSASRQVGADTMWLLLQAWCLGYEVKPGTAGREPLDRLVRELELEAER
jgi:hypothetical protein